MIALRSMTIFALLMAAPVWAEGDAAKGEKTFKKCQSCHVVKTPEGETLAGRNGRTGPNLYGMPGGQAGTVEGFRYGKSLIAAGEAGLIWDEAQFTLFVQNPNDFMKSFLDDAGARSKMGFKLRSEQEAADVWAFLASLTPKAAQ